jgi:hypothetical protein
MEDWRIAMNKLCELDSQREKEVREMLANAPVDAEKILNAALEIFLRTDIPLAPVKKLLASKLLMAKEMVEDAAESSGELERVLEQIILSQELEIFRRWSAGELKDGSAHLLLHEIRDEGPLPDISEIFGGEVSDE